MERKLNTFFFLYMRITLQLCNWILRFLCWCNRRAFVIWKFEKWLIQVEIKWRIDPILYFEITIYFVIFLDNHSWQHDYKSRQSKRFHIIPSDVTTPFHFKLTRFSLLISSTMNSVGPAYKHTFYAPHYWSHSSEYTDPTI